MRLQSPGRFLRHAQGEQLPEVVLLEEPLGVAGRARRYHSQSTPPGEVFQQWPDAADEAKRWLDPMTEPAPDGEGQRVKTDHVDEGQGGVERGLTHHDQPPRHSTRGFPAKEAHAMR